MEHFQINSMKNIKSPQNFKQDRKQNEQYEQGMGNYSKQVDFESNQNNQFASPLQISINNQTKNDRLKLTGYKCSPEDFDSQFNNNGFATKYSHNQDQQFTEANDSFYQDFQLKDQYDLGYGSEFQNQPYNQIPEFTQNHKNYQKQSQHLHPYAQNYVNYAQGSPYSIVASNHYMFQPNYNYQRINAGYDYSLYYQPKMFTYPYQSRIHQPILLPTDKLSYVPKNIFYDKQKQDEILRLRLQTILQNKIIRKLKQKRGIQDFSIVKQQILHCNEDSNDHVNLNYISGSTKRINLYRKFTENLNNSSTDGQHREFVKLQNLERNCRYNPKDLYYTKNAEPSKSERKGQSSNFQKGQQNSSEEKERPSSKSIDSVVNVSCRAQFLFGNLANDSLDQISNFDGFMNNNKQINLYNLQTPRIVGKKPQLNISNVSQNCNHAANLDKNQQRPLSALSMNGLPKQSGAKMPMNTSILSTNNQPVIKGSPLAFQPWTTATSSSPAISQINQTRLSRTDYNFPRYSSNLSDMPTRQQLIGIKLPSKQLQIPISSVSHIKVPYRKRQRKILYPPAVQGGRPLMKRYFCSQDFIKIRQNLRRMEMGQPNEQGQRITLKDMCRWHQCGHSTMHKLYHSWLEDPLMSAHLNKHMRKQQLKPGHIKYGLTSKMTSRLQIMNQLIKINPFWTKDQLVEQIQQKLGTALEPNTIRRLLQLGCYKKTKTQFDFKKRNSEQIIQERYIYCQEYQKRLNLYDIYFMNLSECKYHKFNQRQYGWAKQGDPVITNSLEFRRNCVNLFAIIGITGHIDFDYKKGLYTQPEYRKVLHKFFENIKQTSRRRLLIIQPDPQVYEKDKISMISDLCDRNSIELDFLPICSPQLNPLNIYFKEIKTKLRPLPHKTEDMIYFNLVEILKKIPAGNVVKAYEEVNRFVTQGINRAAF